MRLMEPYNWVIINNSRPRIGCTFTRTKLDREYSLYIFCFCVKYKQCQEGVMNLLPSFLSLIYTCIPAKYIIMFYSWESKSIIGPPWCWLLVSSKWGNNCICPMLDLWYPSRKLSLLGTILSYMFCVIPMVLEPGSFEYYHMDQGVGV